MIAGRERENKKKRKRMEVEIVRIIRAMDMSIPELEAFKKRMKNELPGRVEIQKEEEVVPYLPQFVREQEETTSTQTESPAQKTITATEETAAAKAEDIQPEKTADTSAISAENSFPENTEAAAEKEKTVIDDIHFVPLIS